MEDENKVKKIIKIVIITIIVLFVILIGFFIYRNIQIKTNTNKLYEYVKKKDIKKTKTIIIPKIPKQKIKQSLKL